MRVFTGDDQTAFAEFSGDYNPLHMDEVSSRRTLFGGCVVHGIHMLLWALDEWAASQDEFDIVSLKAAFKSGLLLGNPVELRYNTKEKYQSTLELYAGEKIFASIKMVWRPKLSNASPSIKLKPLEKKQECRPLSAQDLMKGQEGHLELCFDETKCRQLFPRLTEKLAHYQIAELTASTKLVGMECPGLYSIFSKLNIRFDDAYPPSSSFFYKLINFDERFSLISMEVTGPLMSASIEAFLRPSEGHQKSYDEILALANTNEFQNQKALVIGASRGLGEVTAKLLAAAGASVLMTFHQGQEDAERLREEIRSGGGCAETLSFNILDPEKTPQEIIRAFSPTHVYYFATPFIESNSGAFSEKLFEKFNRYYVDGFIRSVDFLLRAVPGLKMIFYPSSIFIENPPQALKEYAASKAAGEAACSLIEKAKGICVYRPRLAKMATDQTVSLQAETPPDAAKLLLEQLRHFNKRTMRH